MALVIIMYFLLLSEYIWEAIISFIALGDSILYQSGSTWGQQLNDLCAEATVSFRRESNRCSVPSDVFLPSVLRGHQTF